MFSLFIHLSTNLSPLVRTLPLTCAVTSKRARVPQWHTQVNAHKHTRTPEHMRHVCIDEWFVLARGLRVATGTSPNSDALLDDQTGQRRDSTKRQCLG